MVDEAKARYLKTDTINYTYILKPFSLDPRNITRPFHQAIPYTCTKLQSGKERDGGNFPILYIFTLLQAIR